MIRLKLICFNLKTDLGDTPVARIYKIIFLLFFPLSEYFILPKPKFPSKHKTKSFDKLRTGNSI